MRDEVLPFGMEVPLGDPRLAPGAALIAAGRAMAREWALGSNLFLAVEGVASEAEYKRRAMAAGRIMQHAHIGFRSVERTVAAMRDLQAAAAAEGARIDRFGVTLDWSMGYPAAARARARRGTGIVLSGPEDFARITNAAPAAAHFGDFMLGLPGALENARAAIAAGATSIGNLGQYFTFRLPYWDDDVATTEATVQAIALIAAQPAEILVHSNLDDGFAGLFQDMSCALGMVRVEQHIVETLLGARAAFCWGHHFSDPLARAAFHAAMVRITTTPGTMIFGNTVAYRGQPAANYASLARYLLADILALGRAPSGHAINPVPVTENQRIPDVDEILAAQLFAHRLAEDGPAFAALIDPGPIAALAERLLAGAERFAAAVLSGLAEAGVDTQDPAALMLAIRRLGPKRMEALWGPGPLLPESAALPAAARSRRALVPAEWARELDEMARDWAAACPALPPRARPLRVIVATTDVHEHGKYLVERALAALGVEVIDGGISVDPEVLVARAVAAGADAVAVSTYNGVALGYATALMAALADAGAALPVMIGGKLNEVPRDSNSGLPVDVSAEIRDAGAHPCAGLDDMRAVLAGCGS